MSTSYSVDVFLSVRNIEIILFITFKREVNFTEHSLGEYKIFAREIIEGIKGIFILKDYRLSVLGLNSGYKAIYSSLSLVFPRALPLGTYAAKGLYLTVCTSSCPSMDVV